MLASANLALHQPGGFQHTDVTRDAGEGHGQRGGQVADAGVTVPQRLQQPAPSRIGQGRIGAVQNLIFNHLVDYSRETWFAEEAIFNYFV